MKQPCLALRKRIATAAECSLLIFLLALCIGATPIAFADDKPDKRSMKIEGVLEYFDVRYMPEHRYTGDQSERGDIKLTLDLWVPPGEGPFPLFIYVHGGSYTGGSKHVGGSSLKLAKRCIEEGIAFGSINYILKPKGIFPQVWWDFRDAMRFLRINAEEYRLDPLRFGVYGISAGGWLVSSATAGNGDLLLFGYGATTASELKDQQWKARFKDPTEERIWLRPMRNPSPAYPGVHGGVSVVGLDFSSHMQYIQPHNPRYQRWVGEGFKGRDYKHWEANGVLDRIDLVEMTHERTKGKHVHIPSFYTKWEKGESRARAKDGTEQHLGEIVIDWLKQEFGEDYRLLAPEIYPVPRVFKDSTKVSFNTLPGTRVHYTLDGSEPTTKSPVYEAPVEINQDTVVKAIAVGEGLAASGVNVAHFHEGPLPPQVLGPDELPPAKTGEPYRVTFQSDVEDALWLMQGDLVPHVPWRKVNLVYPNNMALDTKTGAWSGTPHKPGVYWVQVWVNRGPGTIATHRNYRWTVTGDELPGESWATKATKTDTNVELARLTRNDGWGGHHIRPLVRKLKARGVKFLLYEADDEAYTLIVEGDGLATAREIVTNHIQRNQSLEAKTEWLADPE